MSVESPVLVVGGRVTGMMMAGELARHEIPVRIIDKSPGIDPHSRATYLRARTLEIFHGLGVAEGIVTNGQPMKAVSIFANGTRVSTTPSLPVDSPFPWGAAYAQCKTEAVLEAHLKRLGVAVERSTELVAIHETPDAVQATIRSADGREETVAAPWLVGCDGAHSTTRALVGEPFPGKTDPIPYMIADVIVDGPIEPDVVYLCLHDEGDVWLFLLDEGRRQIVATLPEGSSQREPPTLDEMQRLVDDRGFSGLRLRDPRWLAVYRTHYRLTPHYRKGRVFLAGDAAHIHSVIGGQGMNTGIQDAHNLAWKLALVIRDIAPSWWLDTYECERRRVAEDVIAWTKRANEQLTSFVELNPRQQEELTRHMIVPECERMELRTHEEELDLDYRSCELCFEPDGMFQSGPRAGARAPDAGPLELAGRPCTLIEATSSPRHHLLLFDSSGGTRTDPNVVAAAWKAFDGHGEWLIPMIVGTEDSNLPEGVKLLGDPAGALRERLGEEVRLCLIRPDGYIAYRCRDVNGLDEYLLRVMGSR